MHKNKHLQHIIGFVLLAAASPAIHAQSDGNISFPAKPIRIVVPYPPGALTDVLARALGERVRAEDGVGRAVKILTEGKQ